MPRAGEGHQPRFCSNAAKEALRGLLPGRAGRCWSEISTAACCRHLHSCACCPASCPSTQHNCSGVFSNVCSCACIRRVHGGCSMLSPRPLGNCKQHTARQAWSARQWHAGAQHGEQQTAAAAPARHDPSCLTCRVATGFCFGPGVGCELHAPVQGQVVVQGGQKGAGGARCRHGYEVGVWVGVTHQVASFP